MAELKPCPFCGELHNIASGECYNPDSWWDSNLRGEDYGYVICFACGCVMKGDTEAEAISKWNRRADNG